jgi:hypothetical protein
MISVDVRQDSAARRAAKRVGLAATKSRWRRDSIDNRGGFMLVNPFTNAVVEGARFDLSAQDVLDFCAASRWERHGSNQSVRVYCGQLPTRRRAAN